MAHAGSWYRLLWHYLGLGSYSWCMRPWRKIHDTVGLCVPQHEFLGYLCSECSSRKQLMNSVRPQTVQRSLGVTRRKQLQTASRWRRWNSANLALVFYELDESVTRWGYKIRWVYLTGIEHQQCRGRMHNYLPSKRTALKEVRLAPANCTLNQAH